VGLVGRRFLDRQRPTYPRSMRVEGSGASGRLRLAELIAALSLTTDLGMGFPPEHAARACLLATHLGRRLGLSEADVADVYYTALLKHIGCTAFAREQASYVGGDDNASLGQAATVDFDDPRQAIAATMALGRGHPPLSRARLVAVGMARGSGGGTTSPTPSARSVPSSPDGWGSQRRWSRALVSSWSSGTGRGTPGAWPARTSRLPRGSRGRPTRRLCSRGWEGSTAPGKRSWLGAAACSTRTSSPPSSRTRRARSRRRRRRTPSWRSWRGSRSPGGGWGTSGSTTWPRPSATPPT